MLTEEELHRKLCLDDFCKKDDERYIFVSTLSKS